MGDQNAGRAHFNLGTDLAHITPIPPNDERTHYFVAGALRIGLEDRNLNISAPEGRFADQGPSIHVIDDDTGIEYLRFDMFDSEPHYHYMKTGVSNRLVVFDQAANGDMKSWTMMCLRYRLADMLTEAGAGHLSRAIDSETLGTVLEEIQAILDGMAGRTSEQTTTG